MHCVKKVTDDLYWIGGSDRRLALFENVYPIPRGVSYNSYVILDEQTVLLDTVDKSVSGQFFENLEHVLGNRPLDYMIVNHMEPDHCAIVEEVVRRFPEVKVVGNAKTFNMMKQFFTFDVDAHAVVIKEGDTISTGKHTLAFAMIPMVHWPEAMVTYDAYDKVLFSADAFGTFGALNGNVFADEVNFDRDWLDDARRYYCNIVGKYGIQVQAALKKLSALSIRTICPLHGPVWRENLKYLLSKYDLWSRYVPEDNAVAIFYASMYGDTENAANILAAGLAEGGIKNIALYDVSVTDVSVLIAEAFRCSHLVFAAPTYNNGVYPAMYNFLHDMGALSLQNRTIGLIENGTWGPVSAKQMQQLFSEMKQMNVLEPVVTIKSSVKEDSLAALCALKDRILASCTR